MSRALLVVRLRPLGGTAVLRWVAQRHQPSTDQGGNHRGQDGRLVRLQTFRHNRVLRRLACKVALSSADFFWSLKYGGFTLLQEYSPMPPGRLEQMAQFYFTTSKATLGAERGSATRSNGVTTGRVGISRALSDILTLHIRNRYPRSVQGGVCPVPSVGTHTFE